MDTDCGQNKDYVINTLRLKRGWDKERNVAKIWKFGVAHTHKKYLWKYPLSSDGPTCYLHQPRVLLLNVFSFWCTGYCTLILYIIL